MKEAAIALLLLALCAALSVVVIDVAPGTYSHFEILQNAEKP